ncbi:MAG TPA: MBL fold metallo-hydrolase [Acidimicrobiales bacterium]|nr:MBL fold metallo-hydrolase [Acidimicrobiales bacterium]
MHDNKPVFDGSKKLPQATVRVDTLLQGYRIGTDHGSVAFCGVNLIEGLDREGSLKRIVVDTGHTGRRGPLEAELGKRSLHGSDIDVVVCTHAHWDHIENLNIFERAQIFLHPDERRYARQPHRNDTACPNWVDAVLAYYGERIREVEEGAEIIPGVEIVEAPGHSAGTIAVSAATADGVAVITGDAIQNSMVAVERRNALVFWDNEMASRSIEKLLEIGDIIYPGHDQAFRIDGQNKVEYVQQFQLTITGAAADQAGLMFDPSTRLVPLIMPGIEEQHAVGRQP